MKLPKTFRTVKKLDKKIEELIDYKPKEHLIYNEKNLVDMSLGLNKFLKKSGGLYEHESYNLALQIAKGIRYNADDLTLFSKLIIDYNSDIGLYLSGLTNKIIKNSSVVLKPLFELDCIGYNLSKGKLIVEGNLGYSAGAKMTGGHMIVYGNADTSAGYEMKGGKITVSGNVTDNLGDTMYGGQILVQGDAGSFIGTYMDGGKIIVKGNVKEIGELYNGELHVYGKIGQMNLADLKVIDSKAKIFHQGKQIYPKVRKKRKKKK